MKFVQLIEYSIKNIFFEKSSIKCGGETSSRLLFGKLKLSVSLDQWSKVFIVSQVEGYQNTLKLSCTPLTFTSF